MLLAAGFAAAFTESISTGAVGWTSALPERDYYQAEQDREAAEIDATPDAERQERAQTAQWAAIRGRCEPAQPSSGAWSLVRARTWNSAAMSRCS